jgi:hypothetical protein
MGRAGGGGAERFVRRAGVPEVSGWQVGCRGNGSGGRGARGV